MKRIDHIQGSFHKPSEIFRPILNTWPVLWKDICGEDAGVNPENPMKAQEKNMKSRLILMVKTKLIRIAVCGLILSLEFISQANATPTHVSFSTSSVSYSPGTDSFSINGVLSGTVTLDTAGPTVNDVGTTTLTAAQCCLGDQLFTAQFTLTLGGVKHDVTQPGHWIASANSDRIEFGLGSPALYVLTGLGSWDVTLDPYIPLATKGSTAGSGLTATFTPVADPTSVTPEPVSIMLFGTGLLGIAFLLRKSVIA